MTIEEKRHAISAYCNTSSCLNCPYWDDKSWCDENTVADLTYEEVVDIHRTLFGEDVVEPIETVEIPPEGIEEVEDVVNHPNHYTNGGMECIDEMVMVFGKEAVMHFCVLNAWKYRRRALFKNGEQDIEKSHWYIAKYKELLEDNDERGKETV